MKALELKTRLQGKNSVEKQHRDDIVSQEYMAIPSFIFKDRSVAVLEALVEYMYDTKKLSYHEIAVLLNRNDRTIWTVYRRVKLKRKGLIRTNNERDE